MSKPHCLTHTARFSRFSVKQTQAACSSFHQGEIRDTVKVTGSKPCSKQIDPYFRGKKNQKTSHSQNSSTFRAVSAWVNPSSSPGLTLHFKDAQLQLFQVSAQNCSHTLHTRGKGGFSRVRSRSGRWNCLQGLAISPSTEEEAEPPPAGTTDPAPPSWAGALKQLINPDSF